MRKAITDLPRYVAGTRHGVQLHFCWCEARAMASDATNVFAFADDYAIGVLCSSLHTGWAWAQSSTIREDIRYTPTSAFETFPWPEAGGSAKERVEESSRAYLECRGEVCVERGVGLTRLHHEIEEGMHGKLRVLKEELDQAVLEAYGWPGSIGDNRDEGNRRLLELNRAIATGEIPYSGPGTGA